MGEAIFLTLFGLVVGALMLAAAMKDYRNYKTKLDQLLKRKSYTKYDFSRNQKMMYFALTVVCLAVAVFCYAQKDYVTGAVGIATGGVFAGQYILSNKRGVLYYNDDSFIYQDDPIQYKQIASIETNKYIPFAFRTLITYSGKKYKISKGCEKIINEQLEKRAAKKAAFKKKMR